MDSDFVALQTALAGRYSLERELGRGGGGVVYLAHEVALDRPVALKVLQPSEDLSEGVKERFVREARTAAKLSHPHIVPIFSVDEVDEYVFFAMAAIEGESLGERVRLRGPLTSAEATRLTKEVAWALAYAHAQGVVHRDIKPDNILLEKGTGRALVTDFGIAEVGADGDSGDSAEVVGTAEFMSPEQARGAPVDARSDLYSLAVVGFYAVSGRAPFEGPSAAAILGRHVAEPAPRLASVVPGVSAPLAAVVDRCLRKEPDRRFLGGESIADALSQESALDRQLPIPLRIFIKNLRQQSQSSAALALVGTVFVLPMFIGALYEMGLSALPFAGGFAATVLAVLTGSTVWQARKVLKAGFTVEEARLALLEDVNRHNEEIRFELGPRSTSVDSVLNIATGALLGVSLVTLGVQLGFGLDDAELWRLFTLSLVSAFGTAAVRVHRRARRADLVGERWLKIFGGRRGDFLFRLGGFGVALPETAPSGLHRSTEVALGLAATRLFEELPKGTRRELGDLPATVRALEADARSLRSQVKELSAVLLELGEDAARSGDDEREHVRQDVQATRDLAEAKLREVVTALETIRVGLLRMHAGESVVHGVTMQLDAARDLSGNLEDLLHGHREVERLLAERRATGRFMIQGGEGPEATPPA